MIKELTEAQKAKIPEYIEKFCAIGFCTDPIDFEAAKKAVIKVYQCGDLEPPKEIVYCKSPFEAIGKINKLKNTGGKFTYINSTLEGQHDVNVAAFYEYFRNECGLISQTEKMTGIFELTKTSGWAYLYKEIAFICDRYSVCLRDSRGRLHCDDRAAVEYRDGKKIYFWHGTRVKEYVIMEPHKITMEDILQEQNQEVRRVKIMKFGLDNFIGSNEVKLIDSNDEFGELYHTKNLKDVNGNPFAFIKVLNSTLEPYPEEERGEIITKLTNETNELLAQFDKINRNDEEEIIIISNKLKNIKQEINDIKQDKPLFRKPYALRVNPEIKNVAEAWQSTFSSFKNFLPHIET